MSPELRELLETRETTLRKVNQQIERSWHLIAKSENVLHLADEDNAKMHNSVIEAKQIITKWTYCLK